jgi:hypothetical protein
MHLTKPVDIVSLSGAVIRLAKGQPGGEPGAWPKDGGFCFAKNGAVPRRRSLTPGKALPRGGGFPVWIDYAPRIKVRTHSSSASSSIGGAACVCISIPDHHGTLRGDH